VLYYKKNYKRKLKQWWSIIPPISPKWVSEWVLFNANWTIFQPYHGENKLIINEMIMRYKTNTLNWILIVLAHWNNSPRIDMSLHMHTLFWFRGNPYLLFLLNAACSVEKQQIHQKWTTTTSIKPLNTTKTNTHGIVNPGPGLIM
jgi:hypothetical protein